MPNVVGIIAARGGSKGVPRKNVRPLGSKPLIAYAIECGLAAPSLNRVIVSTDDEEIAAVARQYGADVPFMRPAELASDTATHWQVWRHALDMLEAEGAPADVLVEMSVTSPFRTVEDVEACVAEYHRGGWDAVLTVTDAYHNPYYNMVTVDDAGAVHLAIEPPSVFTRRQDTPTVYDVTTVVYALRPAFLRRAENFWQGRVGRIQVPREHALDIDTELDFAFAEFWLERLLTSHAND